MSNMEKGQSTVENPSPQENFSQLETYSALNELEVKTKTIQNTDQLKNEIDKNKYENLPLQTYNEIVK